MSLYLARHGLTEQGAARVLQVPEIPLSAEGRAQAQRLAARMRPLGLVRIVASDLPRAHETARIVGAQCGLAVETEPLLRERDFGELRGRPYSALTTHPFAPDFAPPGGESWADFHARVALAWDDITRRAVETQGPLLVVTHGLLLDALSTRHLQLAADMKPPQLIANTALTEVERAAPWRVRLLACAAHLETATPQPSGY